MKEVNIAEGWCTVKIIDGYQYLVMPNGQIMPRQIDTKVEQELEDARHGTATVTVRVRAKLIDTIEE